MITQILQRLSVGSLDDAKLLVSSNPSGIKTVVSLCSGRSCLVTTGSNTYRYLSLILNLSAKNSSMTLWRPLP
jgi:hypothetical protein